MIKFCPILSLIPIYAYLQLVFAVGDSNLAAQQLVPFNAGGHQPALAYKQIYQSPWASRFVAFWLFSSITIVVPRILTKLMGQGRTCKQMLVALKVSG